MNIRVTVAFMGLTGELGDRVAQAAPVDTGVVLVHVGHDAGPVGVVVVADGLGRNGFMAKEKRITLEVQGLAITIISRNRQDYISLTDIARHRDSQEPFSIINNWMRSRSTIEFLGLWETLNNPDFKPIEFERFRNDPSNRSTTAAAGYGSYAPIRPEQVKRPWWAGVRRSKSIAASTDIGMLETWTRRIP